MKSRQKLVSYVTAISLACSMTTGVFAAATSKFSDFPNDWSAPALQSAVDNDLLQGSYGKINPNGLLTRAEMASIMCRVFGATTQAQLNTYFDVEESAWYHDYMAEAVASGFLQGEGNRLNPDSKATRQEVFAVMARTLKLDDNADALSEFSDSETGSEWARGSVGAMVAAGYIKGTDGKLNPDKTITRAEFAQVLMNTFGTYIDDSKEYTSDLKGNVVVNVRDVTLKDMTVDGDLILGDGIGTGDATLNNVTVTGRVLVRGGGVNSVKMTKCRLDCGIVMFNPTGETRIVADESEISNIKVYSNLILEGNFKNVDISGKSAIDVRSGTIDNLIVSKAATSSSVKVERGAKIAKAIIDGAGASVSGDGTVETVYTNADDANVSVQNAKVIENNDNSKDNSKSTESTATSSEKSSGGSYDSSSSDDSSSSKSTRGFAGGRGTASNPWQVATAEQLNLVRNHLNGNFILTSDIDLSSYKNWEPIGTVDMTEMNSGNETAAFSKGFTGSFNGNNHTISNLNCDVKYGVGIGLFGLSVGGTVTNLNVNNAVVKGEGDSMAVGAVVGYNMGKISNVNLKGKNSITATNCIGGIAGGNTGEVSYCTVEDTAVYVTGSNDFSNGRIIQKDVAECGGLVVGGGFTGKIDYCTASGTVIAQGNEPVGLGGIAGCMQNMESLTGNTANVIIEAANGHAIGGLAGFAGNGDDGNGVIGAPCKITDCNVTIDINANGATHVGGLIGTGLYYYGMEGKFTIDNCSVTGSIDGAVTPGAVAGRAVGSTIASCATTVTVDNNAFDTQIGKTDKMYESSDQYENSEEAGNLIAGLFGTYEGLFGPVTLKPEYNDLWTNYCAAILGKDNAEETVNMLKSTIGASIYGQEAVEAYGNNPENMKFCCEFINGVNKIRFNGTEISGTDINGEEIFSHTYSFIGYDEASKFYEFKSNDDNSDEFTYFFLWPDTMATTHHIEFRYGSDKNELEQLYTGKYAYWMGAGIQENADELTIEKVISLFCLENIGNLHELERTEGSLSALSKFVGTWELDTDSFPQYAGYDLKVKFDENGTGTTYLNGEITDIYKYYAYDDGDDNNKDIYVVGLEDGEFKISKFKISENADGDSTITFYDIEGNVLIGYKKMALAGISSMLMEVPVDEAMDKAEEIKETEEVVVEGEGADAGAEVEAAEEPEEIEKKETVDKTETASEEETVNTEEGQVEYTLTD